ncbi:hypothetical protein [Dysgonomonas sp. ZJ709]|uniref:hypothetical protein n=1 Tax=Dysgonomonas sp. ZJ709 TaxID=2709797 RepID=UPI0013EB81FD|nr:hypothetical protein [Dysgonomonas sp. ZJ709]
MKRILSLLLFSFTCTVLFSQNYNVPKDYKFVIAEDYKTYEPQIKETMEWLLQTSLGQDSKKRQEANAFFIAWLTGEPDIKVNIHPKVVNFMDGNPELLIPFMIGWSKYALDNNYSKDNIAGNMAGIEATVTFYRKNRGYLKQDKNIEKYEKLIEKGNLEKEIKKNLK